MSNFSIEFSTSAWNEYVNWQSEDKKTVRRINKLIDAIMRDPFSGIGKPEQLKFNLTGAWSRRIDETNRIVYIVKVDTIQIIQVKYHY